MFASFRHIISLFFISILLIKGSSALVSILYTDKDLPVAEAMTEQEQEKNNKARNEGAEELFDKALLPDNPVVLLRVSPEYIKYSNDSLPDVCLDTLTPPPNA